MFARTHESASQRRPKIDAPLAVCCGRTLKAGTRRNNNKAAETLEQVSSQNDNFQRGVNNEWQENESEINVCLGKLQLFIHVSSQNYVRVRGYCGGEGKKKNWAARTHAHRQKHNSTASDPD